MWPSKRHCRQMVYLNSCRFAVNDIFILSHCNRNSVNTWKSCSVFVRRFLLLKLASYLPYVRNLSLRTKCNYPFTPQKRLQNFYLPGVINPFDSSKKGVFVEGDFWGRHAFFGWKYLHWQSVFEHKITQNGGNKILLGDVMIILTNQKRAYISISID